MFSSGIQTRELRICGCYTTQEVDIEIIIKIKKFK
jgi:hypothetical protein